jgi:serine/threonine protein kinase
VWFIDTPGFPASPMSSEVLSKYAVVETLYQDDRAKVCRAVREAGGKVVVLKVIDSRRCRPGDLQRLAHEYEIGKPLDLRAAVRPLALETHGEMPTLVLEDFKGEPLERLLGVPTAVDRLLALATRMAEGLAEIHGQGVVHKDLKPKNILVHRSSLEVKISDFGLATRLPREQHSSSSSASSRPWPSCG